jgi:hypothetical protein
MTEAPAEAESESEPEAAPRSTLIGHKRPLSTEEEEALEELRTMEMPKSDKEKRKEKRRKLRERWVGGWVCMCGCGCVSVVGSDYTIPRFRATCREAHTHETNIYPCLTHHHHNVVCVSCVCD